MSSQLLYGDDMLAAVAVDFVRRERRGAAVQCGGRDRRLLTWQHPRRRSGHPLLLVRIVCAVFPSSLLSRSLVVVHLRDSAPGTTGSLSESPAGLQFLSSSSSSPFKNSFKGSFMNQDAFLKTDHCYPTSLPYPDFVNKPCQQAENVCVCVGSGTSSSGLFTVAILSKQTHVNQY